MSPSSLAVLRVHSVTNSAELAGIGLEASKAFASVGARVIMVNRRQDQGQRAIEEIKKNTPDADVVWKGADFGKLEEVKTVFEGIAKTESRLDILLCSAGINSDQPGETVRSMLVRHLTHAGRQHRSSL